MHLPNHHNYEFQPIISLRYTAVGEKNYKSVIIKNITLYFIYKSCSKVRLKNIFICQGLKWLLVKLVSLGQAKWEME